MSIKQLRQDVVNAKALSKRTSDTAVWWRTAGIVLAGGWHPYTGRVRNRIPEETIEEDYEWEFSEAHIKRLKSLGITLLVGQFDRGLCDGDQADDVARAVRQAELCHKHGIRHGCYFPNTVYYESMLKEHPECVDWVTKTYEGQTSHYGGEQTWRWMCCVNAPGWRARMKRSIERAVTEVRTDLLHFDNLGLSLEPESCHCSYCQERFRAFLLVRYPDARAQKRRFGFAGLEQFRIPNFFIRFAPPWSLDRIQSPLLQEWLDFKTATVAAYIDEMAAWGRHLSPNIAVASNGQAIHGNNKALTMGRGDNERQLAAVNLVWEENPDFRPDNDPRAIYPSTCAFRTMLFARRLQKPVITRYRDEEELAFNLAFGGQPGINMHWGYAEPGKAALQPPQPGVMELLNFYHRYRHLYTPCNPASRVALWRNPRSLSYICFDTHLAACVMEQLLFDNRIPFSIVQDGFITTEGLRHFDTLIAPDVEFMSEAQAQSIIAFVRRGGRLLFTERTGLYNEASRIRSVPALRKLFSGSLKNASAHLQENANIDGAKQFTLVASGGCAAYAYHGRGKVVYLPTLQYVHPPRTFASHYNVHYDGIDSRYWKAPYNATEVLAALEWLDPNLRPVTATGGMELRLDWLEPDVGQRCIPLFRAGKLDGPRDVPLSVLAARCPRRALWLRPDAAEPFALRWKPSGERYETVLPQMLRHGVVCFDA